MKVNSDKGQKRSCLNLWFLTVVLLEFYYSSSQF